MMFKDPDEH